MFNDQLDIEDVEIWNFPVTFYSLDILGYPVFLSFYSWVNNSIRRKREKQNWEEC